MNAKKFVIYLRVSTDEQGKSGLGLDAQREATMRFAQDAEVIGTFTDIETGKGGVTRPEFDKAVRLAKKHKATLLVSKLDRLSRSVAKIATIMEQGEIDFRVVDMPTANKITIHIMAAMAEHERTMISERTKAALAQAKARGVKLGGTRPGALDSANKLRATVADAFAEKTYPIVKAFLDHGLSLRQVADRLNATGVATPNDGKWQAVTVSRLVKRVESMASKQQA